MDRFQRGCRFMAASGAWLCVVGVFAVNGQAQERLTFERLSERDLTPLSQRLTLDYLRPDFLDKGRRGHGDETRWSSGLGVAGVFEGKGTVTAQKPALEPRATFEASGMPWESLAFEADARLALPRLAALPSTEESSGETRIPRGHERVGGLLRLGETSGVDLRLGYEVGHGDDPARTAHRLDVGPAPFLDHGLSATLRPRFSFSRDHTYSLQVELNTREVLYDEAQAPIKGFRSEEIAGALGMCFEDLGPARCIAIMRYTYARTQIDRGASLPSQCEGERCGALTEDRVPGGPMPTMERYEVHSAQVGFLDAPLFDNVGFFGYLAPTWIWDPSVCSFFEHGDVLCPGDAHENRRGGWMMGGGIGVHHALETWSYGLAFENRPGHSPDGAMLGSIQRLEASVGVEHEGRTGYGLRLQGAAERFSEIFCQSCLRDGEEPDVKPEDIEDNTLGRLNLSAELHVDLNDGVRLGLSYDALLSTAISSKAWRVDSESGDWRHEAALFFAWRPQAQ